MNARRSELPPVFLASFILAACGGWGGSGGEEIILLETSVITRESS